MTDTSPSVTLAAAPDLPDILAMIRALSALHGDSAQVTQAQLYQWPEYLTHFFGFKFWQTLNQ